MGRLFRKNPLFYRASSVCFFLLFSCSFFFVSGAFGAVTVKTIWGESRIDSPLLEDLMHSGLLKRLKHIDQSGPLAYFGYISKFSRYEHSVGVLVLLQKASTSLKEQAAGLLHDVSHTTFSHIGDHLLYVSNGEKSYQDTIHLEYLRTVDAQAITGPYGISLEDLDPDLPAYRALEQSLPELCADRIQYVTHTGVITNKISQSQAKAIIDDIEFKDGLWFFKDKEQAKILGLLSIGFTKDLWGAPWDFAFYEYFTKVLKRALALKIISIAGIQYGTDEAILELLKASKDPYIEKGLNDLRNINSFFKETPFGQGDLNIKPKFRGVDPLVKVGSKLEPLTSIDPDFKRQFEEVKSWCDRGYGIKMLITY